MWNMTKPASSWQWGWLMQGSAAEWLQTEVPRLGCGSPVTPWGWDPSILKQFIQQQKHLDFSVPPVGIGVHLITPPWEMGHGWLCWDEMLNKVLGQVETKSHLQCVHTDSGNLPG